MYLGIYILSNSYYLPSVSTFLDCISQGLDHNGGDIWKERTRNAEECGNRCKHHTGCRKWTFAKYSHYGNCYIKKDSNTPINPCLACITGFRSSGSVRCGDDGKFIKRRIPK